MRRLTLIATDDNDQAGVELARSEPPLASAWPHGSAGLRCSWSLVPVTPLCYHHYMTVLLLGYQDLERARDLFVTALGFEQTYVAESEEGELTRSHVQLGDTVLLLDRPGSHGIKSPAAVGGPTHLVLINVGDVDEHRRRAAAVESSLIGPLRHRPWGPEYEVVDHEGYVFNFIE